MSGFRSDIEPAITYARKSGPFYLSEDTLLCLRPSQSAMMASVVNVPMPLGVTPQSMLSSKLPGTHNEWFQLCDSARCHTTTNVGRRLTSG